MRTSRLEAIEKFLSIANNDVAYKWHKELETQVNVAQDAGERYIGEYKGKTWKGWKKGEDIWKNIRVPINAGTNPVFTDSPMTYSLEEHAEGIGSTGWNWVQRRSEYFAYDFDSIANHKAGISQEKLDSLIESCEGVDWLEIYKSTSGHGYHIYVTIDGGIPTQNHNEHAAVARSLISLLSATTGYDFNANVDCVGSIMWQWHRKQEGTDGLTRIKEGKALDVTKVPSNWKEHLPVISRRRNRISTGAARSVSSSTENIDLSDTHKNVLFWFSQKADRNWWWDQDNLMLVCHTLDLKTCHTDLELKGFFETDTSGSSEQNCFLFPNRNGSWAVRRYGKSCSEHRSWYTDDVGWTKTAFNEDPTYIKTMRYFGALENEKGEFTFDKSSSLRDALLVVGVTLPRTPIALNERPSRVKFVKKEGKLLVTIERSDSDESMAGWVRSDNKKKWVCVLPYFEEGSKDDLNIDLDETARHTIHNGKEEGWYIKIGGNWVEHSGNAVDDVLKNELPDSNQSEIKQLKGKAILNSWSITNVPFEEEYPGKRVWNMYSAQLGMSPRRGIHPTWDTILSHIGVSLTEGVEANTWCADHGIFTGADYLFAWVASMIQFPARSLPYLFLFGGQNTGKTTLGVALKLLFKNGRGWMRGDTALSNDFTEELLNAVLCVVEETDLGTNKKAENRLKDLVTSSDLFVNRKNKSPFMSENYTHWIQTSNSAMAVPLLDGDTRISVLEVFSIKSEIPSHKLMALLEREAPAFLFDVLDYELPEPNGRLGIPVIETRLKAEIQASNHNTLEYFVKEKCTVIRGEHTPFKDFFSAFETFHLYNDTTSKSEKWSSRRVGMEFPKWAPIIKGNCSSTNQVLIGNLVLNIDVILAERKGEPIVEKGKIWIKNNRGKLILKEIGNENE